MPLTACATSLKRTGFAPAATELARSGRLRAAVDELAQPLIASRRNVGMVVAYATEDEEGLVSYGSEDLAGKVPMRKDAIFQTGSVSKAFLSLLVAELERTRQLKIDEPVRRHLPKDLKLASPDLANVTFGQLASHTSGMKHEAYTLELLWGVTTYLVNGKNLYRLLNDEVMTEFVSELSFSEPSHHKYSYSNIGYTYLGWILHHRDARGLSRLMQERVFEPLGMRHSGLSLVGSTPELTPGFAGDLPTFVSRHAPVEPWLFDEGIAGAGAVYSTAQDLMTFAKINAGLLPSPLKPSLDVTRAPRAEAEGGKIGLGWFIKRLPDSGEEYTYIAGIVGGHTSFVGFDESRKLAVVVLQNSINHDDLIGVELLDRMVAAYRLKHDGVTPTEAPRPRPDGAPLAASRLESPGVRYSSK